MDIKNLLKTIAASLSDTGVIGKTLPINATSAQTAKKAKIAAVVAAAAALLGAIAQYLS